jgi:DNA-binding Lrp family transcriptional regulator
MDELDRRILDHLREDARTSFDRIGAAIGLSASAVKRRVDRMKTSGVIRRFTIDVDPAVDEHATEAYVELFCRGTVSPSELKRALAGIPEVVDAGTITGEADAIVRIRSRDVPSLEQALERIRRAPNVERTRSAVLLSRLVERG